MTRVLQVLGRSAGGIARHVAQLTAALDGDGFEVDIAGPVGLPIPMPKPLIPVDIPDGPIKGHAGAVRLLANTIATGAAAPAVATTNASNPNSHEIAPRIISNPSRHSSIVTRHAVTLPYPNASTGSHASGPSP